MSSSSKLYFLVVVSFFLHCGSTIQSKSVGVDSIQSEKTYNLKDFGAKGEGFDSVNEDTAALWKAINQIRKDGSGKLYIPATNSFYGFFGQGIPLPDNITIFGDGDKSKIIHLNPATSTENFKGVIFYCTTYGPYQNFKEPMYPILPANFGQKYIRLQHKSDNVHFQVDQVINLGGHIAYKQPDLEDAEKRPFFQQVELNKITAIDGDTITLEYALSTDLTTDLSPPAGQPPAPQIVVLNSAQNENVITNTTTTSLSIRYFPNGELNDKPLPINSFLAKNVKMYNLQLVQAQDQEVSVSNGIATPLSKPYPSLASSSLTAPPSTLVKLGAFDSSFHDMTIHAFGTMPGGNMLSRSEFYNLKLFVARKLFDFGYASSSLSIHDLDWTYEPSPAETMDNNDSSLSALAYFNQGVHDIEMDRISISGQWSGNNGIHITQASHNLSFQDWSVDLPNYKSSDLSAIKIDDDLSDIYVRDIVFENIDVALGSIAHFILMKQGPILSPNRNIIFDQVHFEGQSVKKPIQINDGFGYVDQSGITIN